MRARLALIATAATLVAPSAAAGPPPFAGVTIPRQSVQLFNGAVRPKLRCPREADRACTGTITLKPRGRSAVGRKGFRIVAGQTGFVRVHVVRWARDRIYVRGRLRTTGIVSAHDRRATDVTTRARVTLRR